jgi:hypothetical protein
MKMPRGRLSNLRRTWLAIMLLAFAANCPLAYAANDDKPNFVFVDGAAVTLSPDSSGAFKIDLAIKNSGKEGKATTKLLSDVDKGCDGGKLTPETIDDLKTNFIEIKRFEVSNVKLPATCFIELVTDGTDGNTSLKQIKLDQQYVSGVVLVPLLIGLAISLIVAAITGLLASQDMNVSWNFKLGSPAWEFAKSWASTTTLVSGIIATALALSALPELTKYASKSGYSLLALLISLIVIVAPFLFIVFRTGDINKEKEPFFVEYHGPLWAFLLSSAMTLFAGLAQLAVLFLLLHEVFQELWFLTGGLFLALLLAVALCVYSGYSMFLTIKLQVESNNHATQKAIDKAAAVKGPLLTWSVL